MAYLLLVPHHAFQHDLCVWNNKTEADRTWDSTIVQFCNAQSHLQANLNAGSFFQQANILSSLTDLVAQCVADGIDTVPAPPPPVDQANAILPRETALLERLETLLSNLSPSTTPSTSSSTQSRRQRGNQITRPHCTSNPRHYCWTHGACAHTSSDCNHQAPGHQVSATFANMLAGNTQGCFWLPS